ncbi:MAG: hypothetical protein P8N25_00865 [Alphaproteobacteria bacterium]|nr:hypothetical protein [Alphaproteobacteria bacterium]
MKQIILKTSFTSGEVTSDLYGRGDLETYNNGASKLINVNVLNTGGVIRRSGSVLLGELPTEARLINFSVQEDDYLAVFHDRKVDIYKGKSKITQLITPFPKSKLKNLFFSENNNSLWICSGDYPIKRISYQDNIFSIEDTNFSGFEDNLFNSSSGYPKTIGFFQGRIVIAGTKEHPNRIWFSRSGSESDFSLGESLDDEGIDIKLLSTGNDFISNLYCSSYLILFTNSGEWIIEGSPITPNKILAKKYTTIGSPRNSNINVVDTKDEVLFVNSDCNNIYSFKQNENMSLNYKACPIVSISKHLTKDITDIAFSFKHNRLFCVKKDGTMAVLNNDYVEGVSAWSSYETDGQYISVGTNKDYIYTVVKRAEQYFLEVFSKEVLMDCCIIKKTEEPAFQFSGFDTFNGKKAMLVADNILHKEVVVNNGIIDLNNKANKIFLGYKYKHTIKSLPLSSEQTGRKIRIRNITIRLKNTASLKIEVGGRTNTLSFQKFGQGILNKPISLFSGDKSISILGWQNYSSDSLWNISGDSPLPITILSIKTDVSIN